MLGTASPTRGYLLVEEPGAWGQEAVPSSRLGPEVTAALVATAAQASLKLLLVRRPVRRGGETSRRRLFRVATRRGSEQVRTRECDVGDLVPAAADDDGWDLSDAPLLLVCTHGRKDWDCALRGRPLAAAFADLEPDTTWECSHVGGCRFAANLLTLPSGHTYGRVDVADVPEVVSAVRRGQVLPRLLRGRTTDAMVVQAAAAHARLELGRTAADDLVPSGAQRLAEAGHVGESDGTGLSQAHGERWRVTLDGAAGLPGVVVELEQTHVAAAQRLTCSAPREQYARTWALTGLREVDAPA